MNSFKFKLFLICDFFNFTTSCTGCMASVRMDDGQVNRCFFLTQKRDEHDRPMATFAPFTVMMADSPYM